MNRKLKKAVNTGLDTLTAWREKGIVSVIENSCNSQ